MGYTHAEARRGCCPLGSKEADGRGSAQSKLSEWVVRSTWSPT